jgi:hypothetical protein
MKTDTDWQRPVTADGTLDVRVGDEWTLVRGGCAKVRAIDGGMVWMQTSASVYFTAGVVELGALTSRSGLAWDVPGDKRKGRWVQRIDPRGMRLYFYPERGFAEYGDMIWLPDAVAAPEPVRMDAIPIRRVDAFLDYVRDELARATDKFPDPAGSMTALTEEVGEVAKALLDESLDDVYAECVQVAVVALRVALQGDPSLDPMRLAKGLDASHVVMKEAGE